MTINPFVPNAPFLYPLKTSENLTVFLCFQGVEKGCIENEWVKTIRCNISKDAYDSGKNKCDKAKYQ